MQNITASHNSMRAAVGRRLGVHAIASAEHGQGYPDDRDFLSTLRARMALLPTEERTVPVYWAPTKRQRAKRRIGRSSKRSFRLSVVDVRGQEIRAESLTEGNLILVLLASSDVVDVIEQPEAVWYVDDDGAKLQHWFDCVAVLKDGRRVAYVVKPRALAKRQGTRRLVELLAAQIEPHVADMVMHVDEDCLSQADVYNAELINSVRLHGPWGDDTAVSTVRAVVRGPMLLDDVVLRAGLRGLGFRAIVRLVADGVLRVTRGDFIDYGSVIEPTTQPEVFH